MSRFRNAIPNPKRYMKHNNVSISNVCEAAYTGDYDALEEMLSSGDEKNLYNGDINAHVSNITALQMAAMTGQVECVELLLKAKADPHIKETMTYGQDPEDGRTALDFAKEAGQDDVVEILQQAEKDYPFGWYVPFGKTNNAKAYVHWTLASKPLKGFFSSRPGAAELAGFDPMKYGTGPLPDDDAEEDFVEPGAIEGLTKPRTFAALKTGPTTVNVGLLFPGQGSQYVKMMSTVKDLPKVVEMCNKAQAILGYDILEICLSGPEEKLEKTEFCQPAVFLAGLAGIEKLKLENEDAATRFQACAGLSLGEYSALCAAGVFTFEDGLKLVKLRAELMQEAAAQGKQLMLSVAGIEKPRLQELCQEAQLKEGPGAVCMIANELFPRGFSCAGTQIAVEALKELADANQALQAKVLKTSGAFHTSLMEPAKEKLGRALDEMLPKMSPPSHTVYMNVTAKPLLPGTPPKEIIELLKMQLTSPVLWEPTVRNMIRDGIQDFYEVGPMKQIKAMMKRIDSKVWGTTTNVEV